MEKTDIVCWSSDRLLKWSDFKADANPAEFEDAYSAIKFRPKWTVGSVQEYTIAHNIANTHDQNSEDDESDTADTYDAPIVPHLSDNYKHENDGQIFFVIESIVVLTEFWPCLSWARPVCNDAALYHQQGHFDLGELVMRQEISNIRNSLYEKRFPTRGKNEEQRKQFAKEDSAFVVEPVIHKLIEIFKKMQLDYDSETEHGCNITAQSKYDKLFASLRM